MQSTKLRVNFGNRPFAYAKGHADREAANIIEEGESLEEIAALFSVLPFDTEESEVQDTFKAAGEAHGSGECDEGVVIELSQTGPPTRKLKPPIITIGKCI